MTTLLIAVGALVLYLIAYHTYGRWLARKIFALDRRFSSRMTAYGPVQFVVGAGVPRKIALMNCR